MTTPSLLLEIKLEICKIGQTVILSEARNLANKLMLETYRFLTPLRFVRNDKKILILQNSKIKLVSDLNPNPFQILEKSSYQ